MGQPQEQGDEGLQPDAPAGTLVQNEGVNAGSSTEMRQQPAGVPDAGDARVGGDAGEAQVQTGAPGAPDDGADGTSGDVQADKDDYAGAPSSEPGFPSTDQGESGQDSGSME